MISYQMAKQIDWAIPKFPRQEKFKELTAKNAHFHKLPVPNTSHTTLPQCTHFVLGFFYILLVIFTKSSNITCIIGLIIIVYNGT